MCELWGETGLSCPEQSEAVMATDKVFQRRLWGVKGIREEI